VIPDNLVYLDAVRGPVRGAPQEPPAVQVVIADAQALVRAGFRMLLERGGRISVVGEASDAEAAIDLARRLRPDVVLMDAGLPGLGCVEAIERLVAESDAAVALLTPSESDERTFAALRAGASGALLRDTEPEELMRAVELIARGDSLLSPPLTRRLIHTLAARPAPRLPSPAAVAELTTREREVVGLVAQGLTNAEIAERLVVSPATAKTHVSRAMVKLGVRDRAQLVGFAYQAGIVGALGSVS
jgi:DNA-binding NarL/FixJ family response regulator